MDKYNLLDCTLRDGGYINNWDFGDEIIRSIIQYLVDARMDFIECGYLNRQVSEPGFAQFDSISKITKLLPKEKHSSEFLVMADVAQVAPKDITPYAGNSVVGIRVVFYKHQIEEALSLCATIKENGYKLLVQPMVTIDYNLQEYAELNRRISLLDPFAVSIVDSFGYMVQEDFRRYFKVLDNILPFHTAIGFHSHNNMQLSFITAQDILTYETTRSLIIDSSLYGMGRGAGNLHTELIANYYNMTLGSKYSIKPIVDAISRYIMTIFQKRQWGYSPYLFLTGLYKCHPNFACYLLEDEIITVSDFEKYLQMIPEDMRTKCRKPYVLELFQNFKELQ